MLVDLRCCLVFLQSLPEAPPVTARQRPLGYRLPEKFAKGDMEDDEYQQRCSLAQENARKSCEEL